jgi:hypothetical protein
MPVRRIPPSRTRVTGIVATDGQVEAAYESALERDYYTIVEFCPALRLADVQPERIRWRDEEGKWCSYVPDAKVIDLQRRTADPWDLVRQIQLVEVKPLAVLRRDWALLRPKFSAATRYARRRGWVFKLVDERHIRTDYLWNARFLLRYRTLDACYNPYVTLIRELLADDTTWTVEELVLAVRKDPENRAVALSTLWYLVATFQVETNLHARLSMKHEIWLPS